MMTNNENDANLAIMAYLDHVLLKTKHNPEYDPHPLIKAIMLATQENSKDGIYIGLSGNGNVNKGIEPTEIYSVAVEKKEDHFILKEIVDLVSGLKLDIYEALIIIELNLKLEKIDNDLLTEEQLKNILNELFETIKIDLITPSNYIIARDTFKKMMADGKVRLQKDDELINELLELKSSTRWEDYSPKIRSLIAMYYGAENKLYAISMDSTETPKKNVANIIKLFFRPEIKELLFKKDIEEIK